MLKSLPLIAAVVLAEGALFAQNDTTANVLLEGTTISARVARTSTSSLRLTDISRDQIRANAAGHTFPELIRNVPGIYATSESGSYGDAKINIRGFKQENISVLLNGVPISGLTSGSMYWNNWMGLSDATASIQVQKGIGNSMLSDNSVGGTINIITTQPSDKASTEAGYYHTGYGTNNAFVNISSGALAKGLSFNLMGAYNWGSSFVDCTDVNSWSYQFSLNKTFNRRHSLNFTALGSPEKHQQRAVRLSYDEVESRGIAYNKSWGWQTTDSGERVRRTTSRNNYFKPYFTLTHSYDGRKGESDSHGLRAYTTLYLALADGGGFYTESTGKRIASFLSEGEGQIDWDAVVAFNKAAAADQNGRRAANIMSDYQAGHTQWGLKSSLIKDFGPRAQVDAGVHYQMFNTWEREQITDLLGADYWYEDYASKSLIGLNGRNPVKKVGDFVRTNNGRQQNYGTLYAIGTYKAGPTGATVLTLGASLSGTALRRWDRYNYKESEMFSDWTGRLGYSIKGGILHPITERSKVYANAAVYSRAPYANVFFSSGNNEISKDLTNEKNYLAEIGYRGIAAKGGLEATAYIASWKDKSLLSPAYRSLDEDPAKYMVKGLGALHYGVEVEGWYNISRSVRVDAFASVGNWRWVGDVQAVLYDPYSMKPMGNVNVYADGLHVGDAPQTQVGASLKAKVAKALELRCDWNWNDRLWADFDPVTRTSSDDRSDSYRIPGYQIVNAGATWTGKIFGQSVVLFVNGNNLTNTLYVERSKDGAAHDRKTFTGYWGNTRNVNFGIRLGIR